MRFHPLESVDKYSAALEIKSLLLGLDGSFHGTTRPEGMAHGPPGVLLVGSEIGSPILADDEARRGSSEGQVHQAVVIHGRFEGIGVSVVVEGHGEVVGREGKHALIEHVVIQGIGVPVMGSIALEVEDFRVKLGGGMDTSGQVSETA